MTDLFSPFIQNERQKALYDKVAELSLKVKERAKEMDEQATFSKDNLLDLKESDYVTLTLPEEYGGKGLSLYEFVLIQEKLAEGDGATALSIGWHLGVVKELSEEQPWSYEAFDQFAKEVAEKKKVVNRIASEPATGSPSRGGIPETRAVRDGDYYIVNGRKNFATMASVLDYLLVTAYVEDKEAIGVFLIDKDTPGLEVEHTWNTLGMRGTGSDDLVLKNVRLHEDQLVEMASKKKMPKGWLLHIPACYLGVALAARNDAIEFAKNYQPNSLKTPISEVPHIQQKIGEMDFELLRARNFMYTIANQWDQHPERRAQLGPELAAVKVDATNTASKVVDLAMRIVGGRGLSKDYSFERYYRDVRAGLHNPPMEDAVIQMLAGRALE
ncbi:acyl-CoA dehydrogenase family protein [Salinibacillus xinjiangensis]|uniref:Acyl-CoA dehydrogenase n=1 Tax=Salinibacillus xinjiangensis TaxID=1229268 RepID=A0A6G1X2K6_9BACI|nr:acyl-CoA dehydrogenase family protein [Salinibacillus xinjiangensis]MRG85126.1 acyl-CoA dehydrogenase [Salinibacillus xinjiangensis]